MNLKYYLALLSLKFDRRSKEFKDLQRLYNIYVDKLATMFLLLDITDPAIVCSVFYKLLNIGKLSGVRKLDGVISKENNVLDPIVAGSVVAAGMGVCRNKAGFLCDVLNAMGYNACTIVGSYKKNSDISHVMVGIVSEDGKFSYDPSNGMFLNGFVNIYNNSSILYGNNKLFFMDNVFTKFYAKMNGRVKETDKFFNEVNSRFISDDNKELYTILADQIINSNSKQINGSIYFLMTNDMFVLDDLQKKFVKKTNRSRIRY